MNTRERSWIDVNLGNKRVWAYVYTFTHPPRVLSGHAGSRGTVHVDVGEMTMFGTPATGNEACGPCETMLFASHMCVGHSACGLV